jgi:leader peptidase (prepilin peptidase)/N-methyltransferase
VRSGSGAGLKPAWRPADHGRMEALTFAGVMGAIAGSFLNVVAYRLPRRESVVWPRSHCPHCGSAVRSRDNVPIFSYLLLRGRCRSCSVPISRRYPLVEALTAALCVGAVLAHASGARLVLGILTVFVLVPAALIDLEHRIIPNRLTAAGALLALAAGTAVDPAGEPQRLIAAAAAAGVLLVAALAYPGGMGMGDVKLAGVMGLLLGKTVASALLVALLAGVAFGMAVIWRKGAREGRKTAIPFGPFLAAGGLCAIFAGEQILDLYLHHLA